MKTKIDALCDIANNAARAIAPAERQFSAERAKLMSAAADLRIPEYLIWATRPDLAAPVNDASLAVSKARAAYCKATRDVELACGYTGSDDREDFHSDC
jgi:hypothetical protein